MNICGVKSSSECYSVSSFLNVGNEAKIGNCPGNNGKSGYIDSGYPNEHFIDQLEEPDKRRITDTNFSVIGRQIKKYHLECESSKYSSKILIIDRLSELVEKEEITAFDKKTIVD